MDDKSALHIWTAFITRNGVEELQRDLQNSLMKLIEKDSLNLTEAIGPCRNYYIFQLYKHIEPPAAQLLQEDENKRYVIQDSVLIKTKESATLSAISIMKPILIASAGTP